MERSALALSAIAGAWLTRKLIGHTALVETDPDELARRLEYLLRTLSEDTLPERQCRTRSPAHLDDSARSSA